MPTKKPSAKRRQDADLDALMAADTAKPPSEDKLLAVRRHIAQLRLLETQKADLQEETKTVSDKIIVLKERTLVDAFDEARISRLAIEAEGNLPPYDIEIKNYYRANIGDDEDAGKAYDWLRRNDAGDMIKATYTIQFGKGSEKKQKEFEKYLNTKKIAFSYKFGVPWQTLTSFVKEQVEANVPLPLKLLGAKVGRVATLKKGNK